MVFYDITIGIMQKLTPSFASMLLPAITSSLKQHNYLEISFDFMQIMERDGVDQKLMGDFGKHNKLLKAGMINS